MSSMPRAEDLSFSENQVLYTGYSSKRSFFTYFRCSTCRGLFCRTYFTDVQLQQLYTHQGENMPTVSLNCRRRTQQAYFQLLKKHAPLTGQLMELGPDIGLFTGCCVAGGQFEKFWLYEPNVDVHEALRATMGPSQFSLSRQPYSAADMPEQCLSTAVLIHVLDHILSLESLLADLRRSLKPGGVLFIVTHNEASRLARLLGKRWPPYAMCHPQLFSPASTSYCLEQHGFEVLEVAPSANVFTIGHLANTSLAVLGAPSATRIFPDWLPIRIQLGNIATVARKI